jgi:type I restriction enzyme R subunit
MNERQTEYQLVEPTLQEAGWSATGEGKIWHQFPINQGRILGAGRRKPPLKADYVLEYRGKRLAVIEVKARDKYYTAGLDQAKDYAQRLDVRYTYATNGQRIYQVDMLTGQERDVDHYPTPDELWDMTYPTPKSDLEADQQGWRGRLLAAPYALFRGQWQPRYFQRVAVERVLSAIADGQDRLLLTMATGTGKTATAFHICWKLFEAKWNLRRDGRRRPRILFLADRNILADQAFNAFVGFEEEALVRIKPSEIKKAGHVPTNGSVFFTIFQTFMSGSNEEAEARRIEPISLAAESTDVLDDDSEEAADGTPYFGEYASDFFDLIIIDECHRGGRRDESSWREILNYFGDAVQLGLTATPKRDVNGDTYDYFGKPVYEYSLAEGIEDGYLTPFRVKQISTTGDEYQYMPEDLVLSGEIDPNKVYGIRQQGSQIIIDDIEQYRVSLYLQMVDPSHKTLVFCDTQDHAAMIRDLINRLSPATSTMYCVRVTADDGARGEQHLRDFQNDEKSIPTVLTTSRKLSTGVDAPEVRNIVLLRHVSSIVEFKQIVGRGTRLADGKDYFTIYDFVKAYEHFSDPAWDGPPADPPPGPPGPVACADCGQSPCVCRTEDPPPLVCTLCNNDPCVCDDGPRTTIRVQLADGKARELDSMVKTVFYGPNGRMISQREFLAQLYGDLQSKYPDIDSLRRQWASPITRQQLLDELAMLGYGDQQLQDLTKLVQGEHSDLYDVLTYVAYHKEMVPRIERASKARVVLSNYQSEMQQFLNFVLDQYVDQGVSEIAESKLADLITLQYDSIADAKQSLGQISKIRQRYIDVQAALYNAAG